MDFDPVQVQGLYAADATIDPINAPVAFQLDPEAKATYTDANGNEITYTLDRAGQVISAEDEVGTLPVVQRNEDNLITQQTNARGNATNFTYDFNSGDFNFYRYVFNKPVSETDSTGLIVDTLADIGFIGYDIYKIFKDNIYGDCDNFLENLTALGLDAIGLLTPFATGF